MHHYCNNIIYFNFICTNSRFSDRITDESRGNKFLQRQFCRTAHERSREIRRHVQGYTTGKKQRAS